MVTIVEAFIVFCGLFCLAVFIKQTEEYHNARSEFHKTYWKWFKKEMDKEFKKNN